MEKITSLQNQKVKAWAKLREKKERDRTGLFLAEGPHLIEEAMRQGIVETVITDGRYSFDGVQTVEAVPQVLKKLSASVSGVSCIAVCRQFALPVKDPARVLLLDRIQDPGNFGTLIRTAVSFGFDAVYVSEDPCDLYNEKVIRSTQGAMFHIPVIRASLSDTVKDLQKDGFRVFGTSLHNAVSMSEAQESEKMAFVLGNEGQGVSTAILDLCDQSMFIEISGFESLNVAVAGGIIMYRYRGRR